MKIIDLSHRIYTGMPSIPLDEHVKTEVKKISDIDKDGLERHQILMSCHSGTHIDAPKHMLSEGVSLDKIPLDRFFGKAKKIIVKTKKVSLKDVEKIDLNDVSFLIIQTGWEKEWDSEQYYTNHPFFSEEAADFLEKTNLKGVLIDFPNPDKHNDKDFPVHKILFKSRLVLIENVCNLGKLDEGIYDIIIAPLNLEGVEASPTRVFAIEN